MSSWITNKGKSAFCYGSAQHEFIKSVRSSVLQEGASFFKKKDWKNIGPVSNTSLALAEMKTCSDSFYIKMWQCGCHTFYSKITYLHVPIARGPVVLI